MRTWYIPSLGNHRCICDVRVCIAYLEHRLTFPTRVSVQSLTTANQWRTLICIFKSQLYMKELRPPALDGIRINNFSIDNLTTRTPPIIWNLKGLNFRQWNRSGFLNLMKIISIYQHFQIPRLYNILGLQHYTSQNVRLKVHKEIMKSRFLSTASDNHLDSLMILALHKYILKNIHSLYLENDTHIIL